MARSMSVTTLALCVALCTALSATTGCARERSDATSPERPATTALSPDAFAGAWRSVTPSLEFIRLSVASTSSRQGVLAARLTLSGLAWEGTGRIDGDSLVVGMTVAGTAQSTGTLVARVRDAQTLLVHVRSATPVDLTLVRGE